MIDLEFVEKLIRAVDESGIDHVEIERGGTRLRIAKTPEQPAVTAAPGHAAPAAPVVAEGGAASVPAPQAQESASQTGGTGGEGDTGDDGFVDIASPMVGTFYRAPSPGADPFIEVGGRVSEGDTICIIEAMKLMNELESDVDGVVREVLVENGEPVEYGQILFRVEPA